MRKRIKTVLLAMVILAMVAGCGSVNKYQVMYGVADWYYTNHLSIEAQYKAADPDTQAWFRKTVNPYMEILRQTIIGAKAVDQKDDAKLGVCIAEITRITTGIKFDGSGIIIALKSKDYDALYSQSLILKSAIETWLIERRK